MRPAIITALLALVLMPVGSGAARAQDAAELAAARAVLLQLQPRSFAENVEYCGYIGRMPDGRLMATEVSRGDSFGCLSRADESRFVEIVASFHTHAGFDRSALSEVPSSDDVMGDHAEGVNGYVATPGGRLWYIDGARQVATQICGLGCMGQAPGFIPGDEGPIASRYTLAEIRARER
ncbi:DUF4329 domain-containing protein [Hasllibacter sp. MH4015]|uniref:DUF4329 domain-containing protein n=1 Tax=Hasllibacter sp. MH4015 TaxID=2854029 RepID=UPI001CD2A16E|nr:DUF4329 domain-containing protein [Hasllibacter sp. MH4015]